VQRSTPPLELNRPSTDFTQMMIAYSDSPTPRCLGLVGGLGVGATVHYYQALVKAHAARGSVPNLVMVHADMQRVLGHAAAGETAPLARYLAELIARLARAGAQVAAIPAVTPYICAPELLKLVSIPIINLIEVIERATLAKGFRCVSIFGTRFAIESRMFGQMPRVEIVLPRSDEIDIIHETYLEMANAGRGTTEQYERLRTLAFRLVERDGLDGMILAGTDLSLVFNESNTDFPHVDGTRVHLEAIMRAVFDGVRGQCKSAPG
jgi:aspartate racemase